MIYQGPSHKNKDKKLVLQGQGQGQGLSHEMLSFPFQNTEDAAIKNESRNSSQEPLHSIRRQFKIVTRDLTPSHGVTILRLVHVSSQYTPMRQ